MVLARLLLSGLLIASGLILGAFTLHGYFDPQWAKRQAQAAGTAARTDAAETATVFQTRSRFVVSHAQRSNAASKPKPAVVHRPNGPQGAIVKAADMKPATRPARKSRQADKARKASPSPPQQQQQASFVWPWNLFNN